MKKILSLLLVLSIIGASLLIMVSCEKEKDTPDISIGVMSGPTGMGMAKLMADEVDGYTYGIYSDPNTATADLLNGNIDLLCLPTNVAANLYKKSNGQIQVLAINCLGSLYLLTDGNTTVNSIEDLDGKTVVASVPNSTTGPIIEFILSKYDIDVNIEFVADHDALVAKVVKGEASIVVLPEPKVSAALKQASSYSVDLNLSLEWEKVSDEPLTMGCIVAKTDFIEKNKSAVNDFLKAYEKSIKYIGDEKNNENAAQMIFDNEIIPALPIAKSALTNLYGSIVYIDGDEMKAALEGFYNAINLALPENDFYYNAE